MTTKADVKKSEELKMVREAAVNPLPATPMADNFQGGCLK